MLDSQQKKNLCYLRSCGIWRIPNVRKGIKNCCIKNCKKRKKYILEIKLVHEELVKLPKIPIHIDDKIKK